MAMKKIKAYAIVWKDNWGEMLGVGKNTIVSIHLDKPIVTQGLLWEVVEGEFIIKKK